MRDVRYRGRILDLVVLDDRWEVVEHAAAVVVLALDGRRAVGVEQYRPAVAARTWELPAGLVDPGETPAAAAARELAEETNLGGRLRAITSVYTSPGFTTEKIHLFEATDLEPADGQPDEGEELEVRWRDVADVWRATRDGSLITSAATLLGIAFALMRLGETP